MATTTSSAKRGSPTSPGPCPGLRGSPPPRPGWVTRRGPSRGEREPESDRAGRADEASHATAPTTARTPASGDQHEPADHARSGDQRPAPFAAGEDPHRLVGLEGREDERPPESGRQPWLARRIEARDAEDDRMLDRRDLLDAEPDGRRRVRARRNAVRDVGRACPTDSRGMTTSPASSAESSTAIPSRPSRTSKSTRSRRSSNETQRLSLRSWRRVRRKTSGRWASSSNSSSASMRPLTLTKCGDPAAMARASPMLTVGVAASRRPTR